MGVGHGAGATGAQAPVGQSACALGAGVSCGGHESTGAAIHAMAQGKTSVGLENTTSFVRAVRAGKLLAVATPVHRGSGSQVWEVKITDEAGKLVATGRVRTLSLAPGAKVAGEVVGVTS